MAAALDAVRTGDADRALVPFENSVEGAVPTTLDELAAGDPLQIVREVLLPVSFSLLVRLGTALQDVSSVATHPHAEAQCRRWLAEQLPEAGVVFTSSTADAARLVADGAYDAAVAAPVAAAHYGLTSLVDDLADAPGAVTRFVLMAPLGPVPPVTGADRTTLVVFIASNRPGALLEVLTEFAVRGVNLSRIESRPTGAGLGDYCFSIDCDGHIAQERVGEALAALRRVSGDVRFLGSYPRADGAAPLVRPAMSDGAYAEAAAWLGQLRNGSGADGSR